MVCSILYNPLHPPSPHNVGLCVVECNGAQWNGQLMIMRSSPHDVGLFGVECNGAPWDGAVDGNEVGNEWKRMEWHGLQRIEVGWDATRQRKIRKCYIIL